MKRCSIVDLGLGLGLGLRFGTVGTDLDILAMSLPEVVTTGERGMTPLSAACGQPHHRKVLTAWVDQMERHLPPYLAPRYSAPSPRGPRHAAPRCLTTNGEHELRPANEVNDQDGGPKPSFPSSCPRLLSRINSHIMSLAEDRIKRAAAPEPDPRASSSSVLVHDPCPSIALLLIYNYIHHRAPSALL